MNVLSGTQTNYLRALYQTNKELNKPVKGHILVKNYEEYQAAAIIQSYGFAITKKETVERPLATCVRIYFKK